MSLGYCGKMELFIEDEASAIYRYCGENWNDVGENRGCLDDMDGEITIQKSCFIEPEIHEKTKKTASGRKVIATKRIVRPFDIDEALRNGDIKITRACTGEYSHGLPSDTDQMYFAKQLLQKVFLEYQEQGKLPEKCSFIV